MNDQENNPRLIRVLVADDSSFMRTALTRMIESDPSLRVSGTAQSGQEALEKIASLQPDVVTLDVEMPGMNGLETLSRIMRDLPRPVLMVSALTQEGAETTLEALSMGAFDYLPKQQSSAFLDIVKIKNELIAKIKAAGESGRRSPGPRISRPVPCATPTPVRHAGHMASSVVAMGTSTGGPKALQEILPLLPADLPVAVLIVQHMPKGFTEPFARRLDSLCKISVREATHEVSIEPGIVYIAPAGQHMTVARRSSSRVAICISELPGGTPHTPSVDVMMISVAEVFRSLSMGIIMTGMGADGVEGMRAIAREGGLTVGQDEASCSVYGMPRACAEMCLLQKVVPLLKIPQQILQATHYRHAV